MEDRYQINSSDTAEGFQAFFDAYVEAALWSSSAWLGLDENAPEGVPMDDVFGPNDINDECFAKLKKVAAEFWQQYGDLMQEDPSHGGHDFWLTSNGHGSGFGDGYWPDDIDEQLAEAAQQFPEIELDGNADGSGQVDCY